MTSYLQRYCIDSKPATTETAATAAARYQAAAGWLCKGMFTAQRKDKFKLLLQDPRNHILDEGALWRHLANRIERSIYGDELAVSQTTVDFSIFDLSAACREVNYVNYS